MIRLLFHKLFWTLYDYLGTLTLCGLIVTLPLLGLCAFAFSFAAVSFWIFALAIVGAIAWLVYGLALSALIADHAVAERPVSLRHAFGEARARSWAFAEYAVISVAALALIFLNVFFYAHLASLRNEGVLPVLLICISILFVYIAICFCMYAMALWGEIAKSKERHIRLVHLKSSFLLLVLVPSLWCSGVLFFLLMAVVFVLSIVGVVFLIPLWASISSLSHDLGSNFLENIRKAKADLGEGKPPGVYRRRAVELAIEEELKKPPRTWKDIFKPWEF